MEIKLWSNFNKRRNSTKQPSDASATNKNVTLKESTSIENPTFILTSVTAPEWNYVKAFGHYYFVTDIISSTHSMWEIRCEQDVLATHKSAIGNTNAFIKYATNVSFNDLVDERISMKDNFYRIESQEASVFDPETRSLMISVLGADSATHTYNIAAESLPTLLNQLFSTNGLEQTMFASIFDNNERILSSAGDCLLSCVCVPWQAEFPQGHSGYIKLGNYTSSVVGGYVPAGKKYTFEKTINMPHLYESNDYRFREPYSTYTMFIPSVGVVKIPSGMFDSQIKIEAKLDWNGQGTIMLRTFTGATFATYPINVGVNIPLGKYTTEGNAGTFFGGIGAGLAAVAGGATAIIASGGVAAIAGGSAAVAGGVTSIGKGIMSMAEKTATGGGVASGFSSLWDGYFRMECVAQETTTIDAALYGKPLMTTGKISDYGGYIQCSGASVSLGSLASDRDAVNSFLNSGFYYE